MRAEAWNGDAELARLGRCHTRFPADFDETRMDLRHHSGKPAPPQGQDFPLLEHLNLRHPLIALAKLIGWNAFGQVAYAAMVLGRASAAFLAVPDDVTLDILIGSTGSEGRARPASKASPARFMSRARQPG